MIDYRHKNLHVRAIGKGGIETCYILPDYQIAFDMGRCPDELVDIPKIFLTHGHLDHASGLPYYLSQRSLRNLPAPEIYVPAEILEPLTQILQLWQKIEDFEYSVPLKGLNPGDVVEIRKDHYIKALKANHRVPCRGYVLIRNSKKLKKEFLALSSKEIQRLKNSNSDIFEMKQIPLFAFSGDTTIEFVIENPEIQEAEVLFLECTYIDDKRPVQRARDWGHIHLDEIAERQNLFRNERLVLTHFSRRYRKFFIEKLMEKKLKSDFLSRIDTLTYD